MRILVTVAAVCLSVIGMSVAEDAQAIARQPTDIPAQGLGPALQAFARQHRIQVVYLSDAVDSKQTSGAVGELTSDEVLRLLLEGTGLTYRYIDEQTITIQPLEAGARRSDRLRAANASLFEDIGAAQSAVILSLA